MSNENTGMTLRDYLATHAPAQRTDLTSEAAAQIVGRPMPEWKPFMDGNRDVGAAYQIDRAKFHAELDVALRLIWADAMLTATKGN